MTYDQGVGVEGGGQLTQTAVASRALALSLARGTSPAVAGKRALSDGRLGCASCQDEFAEGDRGPDLAGGRDLDEFRRVHAHGLCPPAVVTDADFAAVNAWLHTLPRHPRRP